jgi:hypothetical protein
MVDSSPAQGISTPAQGVSPVVYCDVPGLLGVLGHIARPHGFILRAGIPPRFDPAVVAAVSADPEQVVAVTSRGMHGIIYRPDGFSWHLRAHDAADARTAVVYRLKEWRYKHEGISVTDSPCGRYRYEVTIRWGTGPRVCWVLLNPSASNRPGATRARCVAYSKAWGFGGLVQRNRFAYRATSPRDLPRGVDWQGDNARYLAHLGEEFVVAAWGSNPVLRYAPPLPEVPMWCLGRNIDCQPRHPLHTPAGIELQRM